MKPPVDVTDFRNDIHYQCRNRPEVNNWYIQESSDPTSWNSWDKYKLAHIPSHFLPFLSSAGVLPPKGDYLHPVLIPLPSSLHYLLLCLQPFPTVFILYHLNIFQSLIWRGKQNQTKQPWLHSSFQVLLSSLAFYLSFLNAGYPLAGSSALFPV